MRRLLVPLTVLGLFGLALGCGHNRGGDCSCTPTTATNCCAPGGPTAPPGVIAPGGPTAPPGVIAPGQPLPGGLPPKNGKVPEMPPPEKNGGEPKTSLSPDPDPTPSAEPKKVVEPTRPF
jgi:hypothetical protein